MKWNNIAEVEDCPPLNKKVKAVHDGEIYIGTFQKDGNEGYCWELESDHSIQWVDIFEVECWCSIIKKFD